MQPTSPAVAANHGGEFRRSAVETDVKTSDQVNITAAAPQRVVGEGGGDLLENVRYCMRLLLQHATALQERTPPLVQAPTLQRAGEEDADQRRHNRVIILTACSHLRRGAAASPTRASASRSGGVVFSASATLQSKRGIFDRRRAAAGCESRAAAAAAPCYTSEYCNLVRNCNHGVGGVLPVKRWTGVFSKRVECEVLALDGCLQGWGGGVSAPLKSSHDTNKDFRFFRVFKIGL